MVYSEKTGGYKILELTDEHWGVLSTMAVDFILSDEQRFAEFVIFLGEKLKGLKEVQK